MKKVCEECGRRFTPRKKASRQRLCGREACRRNRRRNWQRAKLRQDPDYRANQATAQQQWLQEHPEYWREYRKRHPEYSQRNTRQQRKRNRRVRGPAGMIAKMDEHDPLSIDLLRRELLGPVIAKMDEVMVSLRSTPGVQALSPGSGP